MLLNSRGTKLLILMRSKKMKGKPQKRQFRFQAVRNPSAWTVTSSLSLPETICKSSHSAAAYQSLLRQVRAEDPISLPVWWRPPPRSKRPYLKTLTGGQGACWCLRLRSTTTHLWCFHWSSTRSCTPSRPAASRQDQTLLSNPLAWGREVKLNHQ